MSYSTFYLNSQSSDGIIDGSNVIIGGNVGIQTNTPEYSLDINGTFRSSSIVTPNLNTENIILTDSSLNPYSIQSRIEHTKLVENIVTVRAKTSDAANSSGSSSAFFIDSIETPYLHFTLGKKYRFIQTDSTNTGHPLRFYLDEGKTTQFTTNVTVSGTPGVDSTAYVEISVTSSTPQILYYQCSSHSYMGNTAYSKSTGGLNNISVNDLSDVSFNSTTAEDGNALVWNATSGEWEAGTIVSNKPAFQGVDLSGYDLLLKFTENIKNVSTYDPTDFTVNVKSVNRSVDSIAIANGDVNLIMDTGGQTGGVETLIGGLVGGAIELNVDGSIQDSRLDHYLRGLSFYGDYLYVGVPRGGKIRRFNIVTQIWSTFIPHSMGNTIGGMTRDGINFYVVEGANGTQRLWKFPMNYENPSDTYNNRVSIYNPLPLSNVKSFTMSNDGAYIYFGITDGARRLGITRYTISTGVFEYYKTGGLTTNSYSSDQDYLLYNLAYKYNIRLAIDDNYLYFGYNWWQYARNQSKIGRISLSTDVIEMSWKTEDSTNNSWFVGSSGFPDDDNSYQSMVYKDGYLYFCGPSSTGKIVKTSVNDSTNDVTEVGDYVGHIAIHPTLPYLYFAGFYSWGISYNEPSRKGTVWQLTLDVPSYQTFDPITSVDNLTIKYVKNSTSSKNLLGDPSEFAVDNFNYVGTDITGIINGADISFNVIDVSAIFIQDSNVSTVLNSKQATIEDGDLTIARTNGLQAALDAKVESAALINLKPTLTILDLSSGDILLNFTEGIKDVATYDKDDFVLTNEGTVITGGTISVENDKVKFAFSSGWREDTSVGSTKSWWGITSSADGTKLAATVQGGNIWTSTDSGASWTSRAASRNWYNGIASSTDGTKLVASANNGNIWTSTDSGVNWTSRASAQTWNGLASSADGTKLVSVAYNGNIWTSTDSGVNWTSRASVKYWIEVASSSDGTKLAAVVYNGNIWTSTDSGVNWTEQSASFGGTKKWYGIASSADGTKLAAVVSGGNIWTSTNSGVNWTEQSASFGGTKGWRAIASSADGSKLAAAAYGGNLWTSSNSGVTWTEDTTVNATKNWRGIASSADGTKLAAAPNGGNLWTFESVEAPNITDVQNLTVKYTKSATANKNLLGKDSDVAVDSFDFIGTNRTQATITETIDVSLNNLKVHGDLSANDASFNVIDVSAILVQGRDLVGSGVSEAMDTLKELADALDSSANFAANVTTRLSTIESDLVGKQTTISTNDLSLGDISGLYTQLASKQNTISTNDLSLGDISGLYTQLAIKQTTISTNDLSLGDISGLYTQLASKQDTLTAGTNITITGNTISASGGGGGSADITESSITDLSDVDISYSNISDGQALIWNDASGVWKPGTVASSSTTTKKGQVLEILTGIADGRTVTVETGSYTLENVTTVQEISGDTPDYSDLTGSSISYKPPSGSKQIIYKIRVHAARGDEGGSPYTQFGYKLFIDNVQCGTFKHTNNHNYGDGWHTLTFIIGIGTDDMTNGFISSWTDLKTIKLQVIERDSASTGVALHSSSYNSSFGESNSAVIRPELEITAIGEGTVGAGSADITESSITDLSDVDISYSNITNGAYLIWNDNTKKWGVLSANETAIRSSEEVKVSHSSSDISATTSSPGEIYLNSSSYVFDKLFDGGSGFYHSTQVYTGTDNVYSGNSNNVTNNYTGAWVQQQYNSPIYFTKFNLEARSGTNMQQYAPEELKVFVGNDGTNWTEFHDFSKTDYTAGQIVTENFASTDTAYTYIRFVFHKSLAQQYITFVELEIFGNKETTVSQTSNSLLGLSDVDISYNDISDGQALIWNDASGVWNPGTVTSSSGTTIDSTTDISVNNLDISGVLATNKSNNQISLGGHIIPITNSTYDLGSAEYKIRHLFLSDNSMWLGEDHKIEVSDGKMKFRKLQKDVLPSGLNAISGTSISDAITVLGKPVDTPASSFTLADWEAYSIAKGSPLRVDEIFLSDDINDDNGVLDTINGLDISLNVIDASGLNVFGNVDVDGTVTSNGSVLTSDDRLKHNEKIIENAINTLIKINPKQYFKTIEMRDSSHNFSLDDNGNPITYLNYIEEIGIIAQEIYDISELKYIVREGNETTPYKIDYNSIFCLHIAATKELNQNISNQQSIIESHQQEIESLKLINQDINQQLNDVLNENNRLKNDIQFIKNYLGIN